jgi:hypothetical protein
MTEVPEEPPTDEEIQVYNEKRILKLERAMEEKRKQVEDEDKATREAAEAAALATLQEHEEVVSAHLDAIAVNNQAAKEALEALQKGKPHQDENPVPEVTLPNDLPSVDLSKI